MFVLLIAFCVYGRISDRLSELQFVLSIPVSAVAVWIIYNLTYYSNELWTLLVRR